MTARQTLHIPEVATVRAARKVSSRRDQLLLKLDVLPHGTDEPLQIRVAFESGSWSDRKKKPLRIREGAGVGFESIEFNVPAVGGGYHTVVVSVRDLVSALAGSFLSDVRHLHIAVGHRGKKMRFVVYAPGEKLTLVYDLHAAVLDGGPYPWRWAASVQPEGPVGEAVVEIPRGDVPGAAPDVPVLDVGKALTILIRTLSREKTSRASFLSGTCRTEDDWYTWVGALLGKAISLRLCSREAVLGADRPAAYVTAWATGLPGAIAGRRSPAGPPEIVCLRLDPPASLPHDPQTITRIANHARRGTVQMMRRVSRSRTRGATRLTYSQVDGLSALLGNHRTAFTVLREYDLSVRSRIGGWDEPLEFAEYVVGAAKKLGIPDPDGDDVFHAARKALRDVLRNYDGAWSDREVIDTFARGTLWSRLRELRSTRVRTSAPDDLMRELIYGYLADRGLLWRLPGGRRRIDPAALGQRPGADRVDDLFLRLMWKLGIRERAGIAAEEPADTAASLVAERVRQQVDGVLDERVAAGLDLPDRVQITREHLRENEKEIHGDLLDTFVELRLVEEISEAMERRLR